MNLSSVALIVILVGIVYLWSAAMARSAATRNEAEDRRERDEQCAALSRTKVQP